MAAPAASATAADQHKGARGHSRGEEVGRDVGTREGEEGARRPWPHRRRRVWAAVVEGGDGDDIGGAGAGRWGWVPAWSRRAMVDVER